MVISARLSDAAARLAAYRFELPLVIYGAGGAGRSVASNLQAHGIKIQAFIDASATRREVRDELPVLTLDDWLRSGAAPDTDVLICLHNPFAEVGPVIDLLEKSGFHRVLTIVDYINSIEDPAFRYWLAPAAYYRDKEERIEAALALFAEPTSRHWFEACLRLRLLGDYRGLPTPSFDDQYAPRDLPRWRNPMRLVDCGAYNGDSIDWLQRAGYEIEGVVAFEPDPANFSLLAERCADLSATLLPFGVSDSERRVSFSIGNGPSSRVGETGATGEIECRSIDEAIPEFGPSLIKMDVEGSEPRALQGAERTLRQFRPGLAISIYHEPDHLWEIPLYLASLDLGYRMFLRGHGHNDYDLVLYCMPR